MIARNALVASMLLAPCLLVSAAVSAQDVPGIEICTVDKTMERRTSCLQSNVDFLVKTINKLNVDHQQKIDAANRQIEGLKGSVVSLQKMVADLRRRRRKRAEDQAKEARRAGSKGWCEVELTVSGLANVRHARACPGHPRLNGPARKKDVDGRDEARP